MNNETDHNTKEIKPEPYTAEENDGPILDAKQKKRFEIVHWHAVAQWLWDIAVDTCAICRNHIMDLCNECQASSQDLVYATCTVAWGTCGHAYHLHCISRWLKTRNVCPLDNRDWAFQKYGR